MKQYRQFSDSDSLVVVTQYLLLLTTQDLIHLASMAQNFSLAWSRFFV